MNEEKNIRPILYSYFLRSSKKLFNEYERSKEKQSTKGKGDSREKSLINFLKGILPERISLHQGGEIWDSQNNKTEEIDIILYKDGCLKMDFEETYSFLVEGVFAGIEVKSMLNRKELINSIESMKRIQDLKINSSISFAVGNQLLRPLRIVFAYESMKYEKIISVINEYPITIDLVCVLDKGALLTKNVDVNLEWEPESHTHWIPGKASALGFLYFYLATFSSGFISRLPSLQNYYSPFDKWYD